MTVKELVELENGDGIDFMMNKVGGEDEGTCKKDYINCLPVANEEVSSYTVDLYDDGTPYIHIWVK